MLDEQFASPLDSLRSIRITMKNSTEPYRQLIPYILLIFSFASYTAIFAGYQNALGTGIASLATIPVIVASWYFGIQGGIAAAVFSIVISAYLQTLVGHSIDVILSSQGNILRIISLIVVAIVTGRLSSMTRNHKLAILKLEQYELDRQTHTHFLELLNQITAKALEVDNLKSTLEVLTEQIAHLFDADDAFFAFWDEKKEIPIPTVAFGSLSEIYPYMQFEPGEITLTASVMREERPLFVPDIEDSTYISPRIAAIFPSRSMLAIPFIAQHRKLGAVLLGYSKKRFFNTEDIFHAEIVAEQVALVLSKSQLLEDERKQVRQLTALHDVALTAIEAENQDQLIERVTEIIGQNLFPDNFGILLMGENDEILRAHPSYRFYSTEKLEIRDVHIGEGITGETVKTGLPQRIGNVRRIPHYIDMDERTISELSVPIKFKEQILGVINAESTKRDAFTLDDERLLVTLAGQLATALEQMRKAQAERKWLDQLAHSNGLIYSIAHITTQIERSSTVDEIVQTLGNELKKIQLTCIMAVYDPKKRSFKINYTSLKPELLEIVENGLGYPLVNYKFSLGKFNSVLGTKDILQPGVVSSLEDEIASLFVRSDRKGIPSILQRIGTAEGVEPLRLPLVVEENLLGILWVWGSEITKSDLPIMSIFGKQIGISLERARLFQEVQSLALTDPLTGLQNRRSLFELGKMEFSRAQRMNRPFCCMMLDLDHFKQINDNYGHLVGDQVLQEFAKRCSNSVREVDLIGRYGGEEFIILLPETDRTTSMQMAERLRASIASIPIKLFEREISVTVSIGVATQDENTTDLETLIARADQAMYIAKHKGRNRVAMSK